MNGEFVIDIAEDGTPKIEGFGFNGPECEQFSKAITEALGVATAVVKKPEYNRRAPVKRAAGR
jgi:hypothetical protein